jgi:hypothetical protein
MTAIVPVATVVRELVRNAHAAMRNAALDRAAELNE